MRKDQICTPPTDFEGTTPPVPSSSPAVDSMDISPLPHKAPYFVAQVTLPSPSPEATPDEQTMSDDRLSPPEECPTPLAKSTQSSGLLQLPEYVYRHSNKTSSINIVCLDEDVPAPAQALTARNPYPPTASLNDPTALRTHCLPFVLEMSHPLAFPARQPRV